MPAGLKAQDSRGPGSWLCLGVGALCTGLVLSALAQGVETKDATGIPPVLDDYPRAVIAAAGVAAIGDPYGAVGLLHVGRGTSTWAVLAEKGPTLAPKVVLEGVKDGQPILTGGKEEKAYCELLVLAHKTSAAAFAASARRDLTFAHLFEDPHLYRGEVVHFEGRLTRLRFFEAPELVRDEGIAQIYEGWIFDPEIYGANPLCLLFTDLPTGLALGEKVDYHVAFDGYFFKKYRYKAGDGDRVSPLLIGHSPVLLKAPSGQTGDGEMPIERMISLFLLLLAATMIVTVGLTWWYRQGDRRIRARLARAHEIGFEEPPADPQRQGETGP